MQINIRNRMLYLGFGLIVIACWFVFFLNSKDQVTELKLPGSGQPQAIQFSIQDHADYAGLPNELQLYKFVNRTITQKDATHLANKYSNLLEKVVPLYKPALHAIMIENNQAFFEIEKDTGKFSYTNKTYNPDSTGVVPSDEEASAIAADYLKSKNDLPATFDYAGIARITVEDGAGDTKVTSKVVTFYRKINGLPVLGVSKIMVEVGYEGQVVSLKKYYKEVEIDKRYDLKGVKKAIQEFKTNKAIHTIPEGIKSVVLENVTLAYYEDPGSIDDQPYLQPVYHFEGSYVSDGTTQYFSGVLPALDRKYTE